MDCQSSLLCDEDLSLIGEDDELYEEVQSDPQRKLFLVDSCADYTTVSKLFEKEREMMPKEDYLGRLQSSGLDVSARNDSVDWIFKVYRHYSFEPLTACLAVNYLDRFLSEFELRRGSSGSCDKTEPWKYQLLSVSCLSVAAKMEERSVPSSVELQAIEGNLIFEPKTIQRMELLLLSVLKWRTNAVTPLSFIHYFLHRIANPENRDPKSVVSRSVEMILIATKGTEFLDFRPSEIALAVAICLARETQMIDLNDAFDSCSASHLNKERVFKCYELVQEVMNLRTTNPPLSPAGVLDAAALLSYASSNNSSNGIRGGGLPSSASSFVDTGDDECQCSSSEEQKIESVQRKRRRRL